MEKALQKSRREALKRESEKEITRLQKEAQWGVKSISEMERMRKNVENFIELDVASIMGKANDDDTQLEAVDKITTELLRLVEENQNAKRHK